jgi:hypothetical protein
LLHVHVFIGSAYQHKVLFGEGKPIWASNINCSGNEYRLADCPGFNPANVKMCTSRRLWKLNTARIDEAVCIPHKINKELN